MTESDNSSPGCTGSRSYRIACSMPLVPKLTAHSMLSLWARGSVDPSLGTSDLCRSKNFTKNSPFHSIVKQSRIARSESLRRSRDVGLIQLIFSVMRCSPPLLAWRSTGRRRTITSCHYYSPQHIQNLCSALLPTTRSEYDKACRT